MENQERYRWKRSRLSSQKISATFSWPVTFHFPVMHEPINWSVQDLRASAKSSYWCYPGTCWTHQRSHQKTHSYILLPCFLPVRNPITNLGSLQWNRCKNVPILFCKSQCVMYVLCTFSKYTVTFTVNCKDECELVIVWKMSVYICKLAHLKWSRDVLLLNIKVLKENLS